MNLDEKYWTERYASHEIGWDIGHVSTPIKTYIDQLDNKDLKILIPGAGNSYEAEYIYKKGIQNVTVCDLSRIPLWGIKNRVPDFPQEQLIHGNFFAIEGTYDLIIEQTFFCALDPSLRSAYAGKMAELLSDQGSLVGVLFSKEFEKKGPPFGGTKEEYKSLFSKVLSIDIMAPCYNSIPPRDGSELFVKLSKR